MLEIGAVLLAIEMPLLGDIEPSPAGARLWRTWCSSPGKKSTRTGTTLGLYEELRVEEVLDADVTRRRAAEEAFDGSHHPGRVLSRGGDAKVEILSGPRARVERQCVGAADQILSAIATELCEQLFEVVVYGSSRAREGSSTCSRTPPARVLRDSYVARTRNPVPRHARRVRAKPSRLDRERISVGTWSAYAAEHITRETIPQPAHHGRAVGAKFSRVRSIPQSSSREEAHRVGHFRRRTRRCSCDSNDYSASGTGSPTPFARL
jgi:hypothetical protein